MTRKSYTNQYFARHIQLNPTIRNLSFIDPEIKSFFRRPKKFSHLGLDEVGIAIKSFEEKPKKKFEKLDVGFDSKKDQNIFIRKVAFVFLLQFTVAHLFELVPCYEEE